MPQADSVALLRALDELATLGTDRDREQITGLKERLDAARLRVLVAGEAKRGKSTLINALLGRVVLPAGVTPLTAVATIGGASAAEAGEKENLLTERITATRHALALLDEVQDNS
jgi:ribosome biogenesis GTPase A